MRYDVIIAGAGAAGLMAMKELVQAGLKVCLLEATEKAGGRMATVKEDGFEHMIETGAEFVSAKDTLTLELLKAGKIIYSKTGDKVLTIQNGIWFEEENRSRHFDMLEKKINTLDNDCSTREFLDEYFPASEYESLTKDVLQFSEGFELADINEASVFALKKEWGNVNESQYRIRGGHQQLTDYLLKTCDVSPSVLHFNSPVTKIEHAKESVIVNTANGRKFFASKVIVTVPAGILQRGLIEFVPKLPLQAEAISSIGFGSVIKLLFQFNEPFWTAQTTDLCFLLSDETIPTWWTQYPEQSSLLTGWLGGPPASVINQLPAGKIYENALFSLANIFHMDIDLIRNKLIQHKIICWDNHPFVRGGYSYSKIGSREAKNVLQTPINDTICFAGEAVYSGEVEGTVEAALVSGKLAALKILEKHIY